MAAQARRACRSLDRQRQSRGMAQLHDPRLAVGGGSLRGVAAFGRRGAGVSETAARAVPAAGLEARDGEGREDRRGVGSAHIGLQICRSNVGKNLALLPAARDRIEREHPHREDEDRDRAECALAVEPAAPRGYRVIKMMVSHDAPVLVARNRTPARPHRFPGKARVARDGRAKIIGLHVQPLPGSPVTSPEPGCGKAPPSPPSQSFDAAGPFLTTPPQHAAVAPAPPWDSACHEPFVFSFLPAKPAPTAGRFRNNAEVAGTKFHRRVEIPGRL